MDPTTNPETLDQFTVLINQLLGWGNSLIQVRSLYQIAIIFGVFAFAQLMRFTLTPRIDTWLRTLEGWPKWRLRVLVLLKQRVRSISFVLSIWVVYGLMSQFIKWKSWHNLIELAAVLTTAWLFVSLVTRLINNRTARRVVRWGAWVFITLNILGLTGSVANILDNLAIEFGTVHLSALMVIKATVSLIALIVAARILSSMASNRIRANEDISPSMQVLSVKAIQLLFYSIAIIAGLQVVGFDMTSLTVLSGAVGLGLGFGLQKVVSNLVSGVILLLDKSIKPGDVISLGDTFGWISSLGARYVSVLTRNGTEFLIPNEDLITNRVVNWSHSSDLVRLDIHFGVSYDSDPHEVKRIAAQAPLGVMRVIADPPPVCHVVGFGDSSIDFILRFWIRDPTKGLTNIRGNVFLALWDALKEGGIDIPFPRRDVRLLPEDAPNPVP